MVARCFGRTFAVSAALAAMTVVLLWTLGMRAVASDPDIDRPAWPGGDNGLRPARPSLELRYRASDVQTPSQWVGQGRLMRE